MATIPAPVHRIRQERGRKTYDALISTGLRLLQDRDLETISIAELARAAGYSVGAFYARFKSKEEFMDALVELHLANREEAFTRIFAETSDEELIGVLLSDVVDYFWRRRGFWRAALKRSMRDPDFWVPIRKSGLDLGVRMIERLQSRLGRPLTEREEINVRFALQVVAAMINNNIINRPGPIFLGQADFLESLTRAFRLVSDYDKLLSEARAVNRPRQKVRGANGKQR